jgi:hypothetical protein
MGTARAAGALVAWVWALCGCGGDSSGPQAPGAAGAQATANPAGSDSAVLEAGSHDAAPERADAQADGSARALGNAHPGWGSPGCSACHAAGPPHATGLRPYECAPCHGTNGAKPGHSTATPCCACHAADTASEHVPQAAFPDPASCQVCHAKP